MNEKLANDSDKKLETLSNYANEIEEFNRILEELGLTGNIPSEKKSVTPNKMIGKNTKDFFLRSIVGHFTSFV